ncbi:ribbon-helix-helix protein, CopG family [Candidatus Aerophobetes bacterium]|uniref:Ribbon-helix-helix protein, CopG family n=1 Tax=Aerophobetes bacterium TaxID=2030807 RepID=A0A523W1R5_UNCAE|nr:MAG: ribbon-helix-helix protein, CopG family [Candidatus Aerophobetes bacterium]
MMISIYYRKDDEWLLEKVDEIRARERRSRSAVILSLLEEYFERDRKIGEILKDMGLLSLKELQEAIELQKKHKNEKKLGEILEGKGTVTKSNIQRALGLQRRAK